MSAFLRGGVQGDAEEDDGESTKGDCLYRGLHMCKATLYPRSCVGSLSGPCSIVSGTTTRLVDSVASPVQAE